MSETKEASPNQIWQHRLLQLDYLPAGDLARRFNLLNPRSHPEAQKDATESSLEKVQWIDEVSLSTNGDGPPSLADNPDAVLFDGHERVEIVLARFGPDALVPVKWYRLNKEETDFALLVKDQTTGMAEYIPERLAELMERTRAMTADDSRLAGMLDRLKQQAGVNGKGTPKDAEPQIDRAAQLKEKWGIELGQLWQLGEHRLICGDCTDRAVVERVMRGEKAAMVFTDPPYGNNRGYGRGQLGVRFVEGDDNTDLLYELPKIIKPVFNGSFCVIWVQWYTYLELLTAFDGYEIDTVLVWDKKSPGLSGRGGYGEQYEMAVVFVNGKPKRDFFRGNVFTESRHTESEGRNPHPTMKSVSVCEDILKDLSVAGDSVCDPFLGSGTTLIACENLNRRCRAVEVDPGYVGVTLERFYQLTGIEPVLLSK